MAAAASWHFPKETVAFLKRLKANNNRDWFAENKADYERAIKQPAKEFCALMAEELEALTGQPHEPKIFRIHRDLRFSKDKTPYNTHLHISFLPSHDAACRPLWFFGLEPDQLTLGTGVFAFDKSGLPAFRQRLAGADGEDLVAVLAKLEGAGAKVKEPELKRVPAGYPPDLAQADLLRHKGLSVWIDVGSGAKATRGNVVETCVSTFSRLKPVFDWLMAVGS